MCNDPPMIGKIKASDKMKTPKEFKLKVKTEDPVVVFTFYHLSAKFIQKAHKIKAELFMNKKAIEGSFSETDEAMGENKFCLTGFGV